MNEPISLFIVPVLTIITVLFIIIAAKTIKASSRQVILEKEVIKGHEYTKYALDSLGGGGDTIQGRLEKSIAPQVDAVYQHIISGPKRLNGPEIVSMLKSLNLNSRLHGSDLVFTGIDDGRNKISFFITFDEDVKALRIYSFSFMIKDPTLELCKELLELNHDMIVGKVGFANFRDGTVLTVNHSQIERDATCRTEGLNEMLEKIVSTYSVIKSILDKYSITSEEVLADRYAKLVKDKVEETKVISGSTGTNSQQEISSSGENETHPT